MQKLEAKDLIVCHDCHIKRLPKAKELPFYEKSDAFNVEHDDSLKHPLISEICSIRLKCTKYVSYFDVAIKEALRVWETSVAHSKTSYEYLKNEENIIPRAAVIASGGLLGLLYAKRGGRVKKLLFTSVGTGAAFAAFYPTLSKNYALTGLEYVKCNVNTVLSKYGGYDTGKMAEETNEKLNYLKKAMMFESLLDKMKELFQKNTNSSFKKVQPEGETGKSDQDLYTTRTNV